MSYSTAEGRFLERDPIGYADGMNQYHAFSDNPIRYVDPFGLSPNKRDATTATNLFNQIKKLEEDNPKATPCEILEKIRQLHDGNPNYIYTSQNGWIDTNHYLNSASYAQTYGKLATFSGGIAVEMLQGLGYVTLQEGVGSSSFTYEDLGSDGAGSVFGGERLDCSCGADPLSSQISHHFADMGWMDPEKAPNWQELEANEQQHEANWQKTMTGRRGLSTTFRLDPPPL